MLQKLRQLGRLADRVHLGREIEAMLPDLHRTARGLTREPADAEDLVHDACLKALKSCRAVELPNSAACRGWLRTILVNTYRDRYRRERRTPVHPEAAFEYDAGNVIELARSPDPGPEQRVAGLDFLTAAQAAMAALPPEVRVVAVLHLVNGLAYREIAEVVGCPIGTVMSRLSRGRRLLRASLRHHVEVETSVSSPVLARTKQSSGSNPG